MSRVVMLAACCLTLFACASVPPKPVVAREPTKINTPVDKAWAAAVDLFAARAVAIQAIDRSSGLIAAAPLRVEHVHGDPTLYDCGKGFVALNPARQVIYNALVRGDSAASTIRVTARWLGEATIDGTVHTYECRSTGKWESDFEAAVKAQAETR